MRTPEWSLRLRDDEANKTAEVADRRLFALFEKGWKKGDNLLFHCYREYSSLAYSTLAAFWMGTSESVSFQIWVLRRSAGVG